MKMSTTLAMPHTLPAPGETKILFARSRYALKTAFDNLQTGMRAEEAADASTLQALLSDADILVVGGDWKNEWLAQAGRLKFVQSISSGTNQYDLKAFCSRGIALSSAQGVNTNAVSEHAVGMLLALSRQLPRHADNQNRRIWHPGPAPHDLLAREDELAGKTVLVVGLGAIGDRIARLTRAFGMHVIGIRRDPANGGSADEVHRFEDLQKLLPRADAIILSCPLTAETRNILNPQTFGLVKNGAWLVNVARGGCVDEPALVQALQSGRLAGAALDVAVGEPLAQESPLWTTPNMIITPHRACETRQYEENLLSILMCNIEKIRAGDPALVNRVA